MNKITIKTQAELDALPERFDEYTLIEIRSSDMITVTRVYENSSVVARENSSVMARGNSSVEARENSSVMAWGNSSVMARENSSVMAWENSSVEARENSSVEARENSSVMAWGNSSVMARGNSSVMARGNSSVKARENSSVMAWGNSSVMARGNSSVEARENSSVEARENSSVEAWENSSVMAWGNSSVMAWGNSSVMARGNSSVEAYQFAMIAVLSSAVVIKHLADCSVASIRGVSIKIERKDETATVINTPTMQDLNIPFETWLERGYVVADGIYQKFVSRKSVGEVEVFTVQDFSKRKESFVVRRGDTFSHGATPEEAIKDLRYKIGNRDTSEFRSWTLDTKVSIEDAIQSYRVITGACEFGVKQFCQGIEVPEEITIAEVIEKTRGQYGNEKYQAFFEQAGD